MKNSSRLQTMRIPLSRPVTILFLLCLLCPAMSSPAAAAIAVHYVAPGGNCGGMSPCYANIGDAVIAAKDNDVIKVAKGTYSKVMTSVGITAIAIIYDKHVTLRGGYTTSNWSNSNPETNPTIIDPKGNGIGIYARSKKTGYGEIIIDGFSITGGNATKSVAGTDSGAAILGYHTIHRRLTITNCRIYGNVTEGVSAAIRGAASDHMHVEDCHIVDNADTRGLFIRGDSPTVKNNVIQRNGSDGIFVDAGGSTKTEIRDNVIEDNGGSGIDIQANGGVIRNNTIIGNTGDTPYPGVIGPGGGIEFTGKDFLITNNVIRNNTGSSGGGISVGGSNVTVRANRIEENQTTSGGSGGGMDVHATAEGSYVLVTGNTILSNTASSTGGGISAVGLADIIANEISGNSAQSGGGISANVTGEVSENTITNNTATNGGGISATALKDYVLRRNLIKNNRATSGDGGGIHISASFWDPDFSIDGNRLIDNTASGSGGGLFMNCQPEHTSIPISNTVVAGNVASAGSGIYDSWCSATLYHSTIADHSDGDGVGLYVRNGSATGPVIAVENSIIAKNKVGVYVKEGEITMNHTLWGSEAWANVSDTGGSGTVNGGAGDLHAVPEFVKPANNNYHIRDTSPAINKGVDVGVDRDMDGQARPKQGSQYPDLGADEFYTPEEAAPPQGVFRPMCFDK